MKVLNRLHQAWPAWSYGYDLGRDAGLKSGTLYPILMRLADRQWLESKWEASPEQGRPARHLYRLTAKGRRYAAAEIQPELGLFT